MFKETPNSPRILDINRHTSELHDDIASLNEALVDKLPKESLDLIERIRKGLTILKAQILENQIT
jgi:hypothetical protein